MVVPKPGETSSIVVPAAEVATTPSRSARVTLAPARNDLMDWVVAVLRIVGTAFSAKMPKAVCARSIQYSSRDRRP